MIHICFCVICMIHSDLDGDSLEEASVVIQVRGIWGQDDHGGAEVIKKNEVENWEVN